MKKALREQLEMLTALAAAVIFVAVIVVLSVWRIIANAPG